MATRTRKMTPFLCENCGIPFEAYYTPGRKYCTRKCGNEAQKGKRKAPRGSGHIGANGYRYVMVDGKTMLEHRYKMEQTIGRALVEGECVHHKNGIKTDNSPENLELLSNPGEHRKLHTKRFADATHKECCHCETIKLREEFHFRRRGHNKDPHASLCKQCQKEIAAGYRQTRLGKCSACGRADVYIHSKGMCSSCSRKSYREKPPS